MTNAQTDRAPRPGVSSLTQNWKAEQQELRKRLIVRPLRPLPRLIGTYDEPAPAAGSAAPLMDKGEQIGIVLRTRDNTRPLFISIGHRIDLATAADLVLACCTKYRIPEPTRQADIEVAKLKRQI